MVFYVQSEFFYCQAMYIEDVSSGFGEGNLKCWRKPPVIANELTSWVLSIKDEDLKAVRTTVSHKPTFDTT